MHCAIKLCTGVACTLVTIIIIIVISIISLLGRSMVLVNFDRARALIAAMLTNSLRADRLLFRIC